MKVNGKHYRTVWMKKGSVFMIEQNLLPFEFKIYEAANYLETCEAIKTMIVRGAGAIGATAGYAMAQAFLEAPKGNFKGYANKAKKDIEKTRPTAQNLFYATDRVFYAAINLKNQKQAKQAAIKEAKKIADEDAESCRKIGEYGNKLIKSGDKIMTHCNAGWLAFVDCGSALSPVYVANKECKSIFIYVGRTGPRDQGARLTAWELKNENIPYNIFDDTTAAYLMSKGSIDMIIVGADRIAKNGDVANKIGTLDRAILANHFNIPFYVAAPTSTFDLNCKSGKEITIEQRSEDEVLYKTGLTKQGNLEKILVCCPGSSAYNPAFDVTPACYITGIITEKGIIKPEGKEIEKLLTYIKQSQKG